MTYEKKIVYRAGVIPYFINEDGEILMMFMKPSDTEYGGDSFQLAKGKVDDNESALVAALREAKEELGLFIGNVIFTKELGVFMGRTTVFLTKIKRQDMFGEPSYETSAVKWMTQEQFMEEGRDLHKPVVQAAVRMIHKLEKT